MVAKSTIDGFLGEKTLAVAGVSRNGKKFGNAVYKELKQKGYTVYPINPNAQTIEGETCYPDIASLPEQVGGVVAVVHPDASLDVARQAKAAGIRKLWLQQGADSEAVLTYCADEGIETVYGQCIMMFAEPVASIHSFHRFLKKLFGRMPK